MTDDEFISCLNLDPYDCIDCNDNTFFKGEYYMIHNQIWNSVAQNGMLCIQCLEARLGRQLNSSDFTEYPINFGSFPQSDLLYSRIYSD